MRPGITEDVTLAGVIAVVDEARCIGCTLCIQACPVDAIMGAAKLMHTVIADACTGCELCIPPCPVDCITVVPVPRPAGDALAAATAAARERCDTRNLRLARDEPEHARRLKARRAAALDEKKRDTIRRAVERARLRLADRDA